MVIENDDKTFAVGQSPMYAYDESADIWRKVRCDETGAIFASQPDTQSDVAEPSTSSREIHDGPAQVVSVTNTTTNIVSILDGATVVALVLPSTTLNAPITINSSLNILSAGASLGKKVATIWRPMS